MNEHRPDPDALLAEIQGEVTDLEGPGRRGRLKVFFGATAGVGKTYAMLEAARERARAGLDVVVGVVETHGRKETAALLEGLDVLPRRRIQHRGIWLEELDLEGALARRPEVLLVDELAHTNAPGSRHQKRWQDVEELLAAGIDVYATVNVQHLESLNDVVARVTHVRVQETVPDRLVEEAHQVELIDLPPDELLQRLSEGKVYVPEQVERARQHFFQPGNLIALRQLALRYTAGHVDERMRGYRRAHGVGATWPVGERLVVGIGPAPSSRSLVRATKRIATQLGAEWHAVFVETPESSRWPEEDRKRVWETLSLARELGAETATVGGSGAAAILDYARRENATRIVVGKPHHSRWRDRLFGSRIEDVIRRSGDVDVYVISGEEEDASAARRRYTPQKREPIDLAIALAAVAAVTGLAVFLRERTDLANIVMLYLAAIVALAALLGRRASLLASLLSVAAFDFFGVPPYNTFAVRDARYLPVFAVMLVVALVVSTLTARLRAEVDASRRRERRTAALLGVTRELVPLEEPTAIAAAVTRQLTAIFGTPVRLLAPDPFGRLRTLDPAAPGAEALTPGVAEWVRNHGKPAGLGTSTLPDSGALYVPVAVGEEPLAVLEVPGERAAEFRDPEQMQLLETFARQTGAALERARLAAMSRRAEHLTELSRLKSRFIAVASHELRNPLNSLGLAVELLEERLSGTQLADDAVSRELLAAAHGDVSRLRTLAKELLDLSRLEAGAVELHLQDVAPATLIQQSISSAEITARERGKSLLTEIAPGVALVRADPALVARALDNLIDNALRHAAGKVVVTADLVPDFVQFSVADDGPGVPLQEQERIFEPFAGEGSRESVGLGLSITREIVRAHGGDVWVDSGPGPGAVFTFNLPLAATATVVEESI
ncbi:MAG: sensor histidine kinase KdpD [Longimicrobiales bacterium]